MMGIMCFSLCLRKRPLCPGLHCPFSPAISLCCKTQASVYYDEQLQERRKNRMVCFSCVQLFVTLWTVALQVPLSMGFSRYEYWSVLPCPPPGDLPNAGIKPASLTSPALAGRFFTNGATWKALLMPWL